MFFLYQVLNLSFIILLSPIVIIFRIFKKKKTKKDLQKNLPVFSKKRSKR